jgi:hypothetical protein
MLSGIIVFVVVVLASLDIAVDIGEGGGVVAIDIGVTGIVDAVAVFCLIKI